MVDMEQGLVVVRGGAEGFVQQITSGRHRLIADEPVSSGGTTEGLDPTNCCWLRSAPEHP